MVIQQRIILITHQESYIKMIHSNYAKCGLPSQPTFELSKKNKTPHEKIIVLSWRSYRNDDVIL
jgi:hypothetical protein